VREKTASRLERDLRAELERAEREDREAAGGAITHRATILASLANRLSRYVGDGEDSYLADRPTNVPSDAPLIVFDLRRTRSSWCPRCSSRSSTQSAGLIGDASSA